jgi:hypothetical protein
MPSCPSIAGLTLVLALKRTDMRNTMVPDPIDELH